MQWILLRPATTPDNSRDCLTILILALELAWGDLCTNTVEEGVLVSLHDSLRNFGKGNLKRVDQSYTIRYDDLVEIDDVFPLD